MKREYFTALFLIISVALILTAEYIFGREVIKQNLYRFIVVWLLLAFFLGQYSTKFPKAFK